MTKRIVLFAFLAFFASGFRAAQAADEIQWRGWSDDVFKTAAREHKLVLLNLGAVWCHWCHVIEGTTYRDKDVVALINQHYIAVRVDQDAYPNLTARYKDYGWPATIIFDGSATEIVKRRGYVDPPTMQIVLKETAEDPTPNPRQTQNYPSAAAQGLTGAQRDAVLASVVYFYDHENGGWGDDQKFLEPNMIEFALNKTLQASRVFTVASEKSLQASYALIDPVWGGVYQYSDTLDWKSPHFEKILSAQSTYIHSYAYAAGLLMDPQYAEAAGKIVKYIDAFLTSPDGAFYTSQDADLSETVTGHDYYPLGDTERRRLGLPRIDTHIYANENGTLISSLTVLYAMTGDRSALDRAIRAAAWLRNHRALAEAGGFAHGEADSGGPFLADTLAMGRAVLDLYAATGDRAWLTQAQDSARFIVAHFADAQDGGFFAADPRTGGMLKPYKQFDRNIAAARFFNLLSFYTHDKALKDAAISALRSVTSPEAVQRNTFSPGLLLADGELKTPPLHLTVVGHKDDPAAQALYKTALSVTPLYKQTEWLDRREGKLPGADIDYPDLPQAAAFVCTDRFCSLPVYDSKTLTDEVEGLR